MHDFTTTYDLYQNAIFRYCLWKCHDCEMSKDLTQETFLRFYLCLQRKQEILLPRAFLYRIAHNLFINQVRRKKEASLDQLLEAGFAPATNPWHATHNKLDVVRPLQKLATMQGPYKQVLTRRFIQQLAPAEIANMTGESPNTISVRISRGLHHLRGLLESEPVCTSSRVLVAA